MIDDRPRLEETCVRSAPEQLGIIIKSVIEGVLGQNTCDIGCLEVDSMLGIVRAGRGFGMYVCSDWMIPGPERRAALKKKKVITSRAERDDSEQGAWPTVLGDSHLPSTSTSTFKGNPVAILPGERHLFTRG